MQCVQRYRQDQELAQEEMILTKSEVERLIEERIIGRNAERNRAIIRRRLIDGVTYERLAEEFDLSVRQVKNIVYRCEDRMFSR